jgi:AraC-like DNA-binding protein
MSTSIADTLSTLFESIEINSTALGLWELRHPWGIAFPGANGAILHAITMGMARIEFDTGAAFQLEPGDVLLTTRFGPGRVMSREGVSFTPLEELWAERGLKRWAPGRSPPSPSLLQFGGEGARTILMGVLFDVREPWRTHLLLHLPPYLHFKRAESVLAPWLEAALYGIVEENARQPLGYAPMARRITEMVLFSCIRSYLASPEQRDVQWLTALTDPRLAKVMTSMRTSPARHWTLSTLAREAGMSRSTFAARFHEVLAMSPMKYLRDLRMRDAAEGLAVGRLTVKDAARQTGYASSGAFRAAFKRQFGVLPHEYGRQGSPKR